MQRSIYALVLLALHCVVNVVLAASITRGPYLQQATPTSIIVQWRTDVATTSRVQYGTVASSLNMEVTDGASVVDHAVTVTGLTPGAQYYYNVGTTTTVLGGDASYHFRTPTANPHDKIRVWALGDAGTANGNQRAVRDAFYAWNGSTETDLVLLLGDNAYSHGTDAQYQAGMFDIYPQSLRQTVFWSTIGNHDTALSYNPSLTIPYFKIFTNPTNAEAGGVASGTEKYYSFDYGPIHFVCLDSMTSDRSATGAMATWAIADLNANTKPWTVAFWHHPPYSKGSHNSDSEFELKQMRQNILPLLEARGVDLVLGGHSHSYERSYLIDGHYDVSSTFTNAHIKSPGSGATGYTKATDTNGGAVYAVPGSAGKISGGTLNHPVMYSSLNELGSFCFEVHYNTLQAWMIRSDGVVRDNFSIVKIMIPGAPPAVPTILNGHIVTPTFTGTTTPNATVHIYSGSDLIGTAVSDESGYWSYTVETPLSAGSHVITITSTPPGGVASLPSPEVSITVSNTTNTVPTASIVAPAEVGDVDYNGSEMVTFDGTGSSDAEGPITYLWTEDASTLGSNATLQTPLTLGVHYITLTVTDNEGLKAQARVRVRVKEPLLVQAGSNQTVPLVPGSDVPVAGAVLAWDAAQDLDGDAAWQSTTATTYDWTFAGTLSPVAVSDARFTKLTHAYEFPAAKSGPMASMDIFNENNSATWEFVLDTDSNDGLILESGGTTDGVQFWIAGGVLKGEVRDGSKKATVSYSLTPEDKAGFIHLVYVINMQTDRFMLYVNNQLVDTQMWGGTDWCGSNESGLGMVGNSAPAGNPGNFSGKMALVRFYEATAFSGTDVAANFYALQGINYAIVNLNGSIVGGSGGPLTVSWNVEATNPSGLPVVFGDTATLTTTALFTNAGQYTLRLTVDDGEEIKHNDVVITVTSDVTNTAPVAVAVLASPAAPVTGDTVTLSGDGSYDPDVGDVIESYQWVQQAGAAVTLNLTDPLHPTFVPTVADTYSFKLTVSDGELTGIDTVDVTVATNLAPVAVAVLASPAAPVTGNTVTLSGDGSYDPNAGDAIESYQWVQQAGAVVTLNLTDPLHPTFVPTVADTYSFKLTVSDGELTGTDTVDVIVTAGVTNTAPVAVAVLASPAAPIIGDTVTLSGDGSYDPDVGDAIESYQWVQQAGASVTLNLTDQVHPTFVPTVADTYSFKLTVSDGDLTGNDTVNVVVLPLTPPSVPTVTNGTTTTPTVSGTTLPNKTVSVYVDGVLNGTTTSNGSGNYSYTIAPPLTEGAHVITVTVTNGSIESGPSTGVNITVTGGSGSTTTSSSDDGDSSCGFGAGAAAWLLICGLLMRLRRRGFLGV